MKYGSGTVRAEDYFKETEEYIERFFGNKISNYDLEHRFPREGATFDTGKPVDDGYEPEAYDLPEGSPFTSKDVAMLGYLACGVAGIELAPEYKLKKNFEEAIREAGGNETVESRSMRTLMINTRGMETDSFFSTECRHIAGNYTKEMTREHQFVRDAVCENDLPRIADLCRRGLDITRGTFTLNETRIMVNKYADGYVCGQILELLDRNQELAELVGLTPEEYSYYRGIARVSDIIREGTRAGEMLVKRQELTPEQRAEYEKAYSRYRDLSIMTSLEKNNIRNSDEYQKLSAQLVELVGKPDVKKAMDKRMITHQGFGQMALVIQGAWEKDSDLIRRIGESDVVGQETFFEELHGWVQTAGSTGKVPGYDNLKEKEVKEMISNIDTAEEKLHDSVGIVLDEYFREAENNTHQVVNRGDLITVDGKTIHEIMAETIENEGVDSYYENNVIKRTKEILMEAIKEGKYVEFFSVRPDGTIEGEPRPLAVYPGVEPAPLRPEDAQKVQASRERVRLMNQRSLNKGNRAGEFIGDWMQENQITNSKDIPDAVGKNPRGLSLDRSALPSLTVVALFQKGYSIEDIANPEKLRDIKQQTGREVIDHIKNDDYEWLGETVIRGQKQLLDQLDERMKDLNLNDERQLMAPENRDLFFVSHCVFDVHQETKHFKEELLAGAGKMDPQNPEQVIADFDNRANTLPFLLDQMNLAMEAKIQLSHCPQKGGNTGRWLNQITTTEFARRTYAQKHTAQPDTPLSRCFTKKDMMTLGGYANFADTTKSYKDFKNELKDPEVARVIGRELLCGNLSHKLDMEMTVNPQDELDVKVSFGIDRMPIEIRDEVYKPKVRKILREEKSKFHGAFRTGIEASIRELDKADPLLLRSSQQYKVMQAQARNMSGMIQNIGEPLTYQDIQYLRQTSAALIQSVEAYKKHKEINHTGSNRELRRITAADNLLQLGRQIAESVDRLNQTVEMDPQLRTQKAALENINTSAEKTSAEVVLEEEREQQRAQREAVSKEVLEHMNRRYGKDAPSIYHAAGSMVEVKTANEEQKTISVVEKLGHDIMKHKDIIGVYINGGTSVDPKWQTHLRNTMARMVAMESIVMERIVNRYQPGQETVVPGPQENAYAKDSSQYLKSIMKTDTFKKAMSEMNPEKMKDFILKDGAMEMARSMQTEAVKKAQTAEKDAPEKQIQQNKQKEITL